MTLQHCLDHSVCRKTALAVSLSLLLCTPLSLTSANAATSADSNVQTSTFRADSIGTDHFNFTVTNTANSIGYYKLLASSEITPSPEDLKRTAKSVLMTANQPVSLNMANLYPSTAYVLYFVAADSQGVLQTTVQSLPVQTGRDVRLWPFSSDSIWNTPIGSGAVYGDANLPAVPGVTDDNKYWSMSAGVDTEIIVLTPNETTVKVVQNTSGWQAPINRCYSSPYTTSVQLAAVPMPASYIIPNSNKNNGGAFLMQDGRTLLQMQPATHCNPDDPITALLTFPKEDLYGPGTTGAHGGSRLSTLGGTLRLGELRPNTPPPRHALKIDVDTRVVFPKCSRTDKTLPACFRWPALTADSQADKDTAYSYGKMAQSNVSKDMSMGALLALPKDLRIEDLQLETSVAKQLAWTLQNYGAYIVDSSGGFNYFFGVETGPAGNFTDQFAKDWGFNFDQYNKNGATAWVRDIQRIIVKLKVVTNNGPTSIGGGGTPLQPLAVPLSPPATQLR
ncbi:hypothetical protein [Undibacterium sp. TS12]|uniref:hypothetical protein n=1 Tax=Undibacterium sp. TS12 TaxID=2908202 RepID=UPI001F4CF3AD|nr:hypothetical protein [Undibacterium sp. TS12]MCH8619319.1 hypothetical protein [Undibacterium sp. TS12]